MHAPPNNRYRDASSQRTDQVLVESNQTTTDDQINPSKNPESGDTVTPDIPPIDIKTSGTFLPIEPTAAAA